MFELFTLNYERNTFDPSLLAGTLEVIGTPEAPNTHILTSLNPLQD